MTSTNATVTVNEIPLFWESVGHILLTRKTICGNKDLVSSVRGLTLVSGFTCSIPSRPIEWTLLLLAGHYGGNRRN